MWTMHCASVFVADAGIHFSHWSSVSAFGAGSESAALEAVFFDFYKACLTHFWRCCVSFPLHHPLPRENPLFLLGVTTIQAVPSKRLFSYFCLCLPNG